MKRTFTLTLLLTLAFALSACTQAASLPSGTWNLVSLNGSAVLPDTPLTIEFADGQVGGFSGCNSFGGTYTQKGSDLQFVQMESTLMACAETGVMEQERVYLAALQAVNTFTADENSLTLSGEGVELVYTR